MLEHYKPGYYYLHVNGTIQYISNATYQSDGGEEFLKNNKSVVHHWYVENLDQYKEMLVAAKMLDSHLCEYTNMSLNKL
jgi:hypothetical protein